MKVILYAGFFVPCSIFYHMKKLFTLLALVFVLNANAQTTNVLIPDANFVTYLQSIVPAAMTGDSLNTSSTLVTTTTHTINVYNKNITDLTGIQYFSSLIYLNCQQNSLTSIPALPNSLQNLNCGFNSITSLPTLPNSLKNLFCFANPITNIIALPSALDSLICSETSVTNLPPLPNTLTYLNCEDDYLTTLPTLPDSLRTLICNNNNISCFPTFPISITYIYMENNPFNCLPNYITGMSAADLAKPLCSAGNTNGCAVATGIINFIDNNTQITIYPNPNTGNFVIETNATTKQTIQIYDVNGKIILTQSINSKATIDASNLPSGIYNVSVISNWGVVNKRIVIAH